MKKFYFVVSLLMVFMLAPIAMANEVSTVNGYGPYQTGSGGEFTFRPDAQLSWILNGYINGVTKNVQNLPATFQTFCVETQELVYPNATYDARISDHSIYTNMTLTKGAAWLYYQFEKGTLQGYDYTRNPNNGANETQELQDAIWYFMGVGSDPGNQFSALGIANGGLALNNGQYPVAVLNLWAGGHVGDINFRRQDMLVGPVPEPATMLLLGSGLIGLAGYGRKKFFRR